MLDGSQADVQQEEAPEDMLIQELADLLVFVKSNKECVDTVLVDDELIAKMEDEVDLNVMSARDEEATGPKTLINRLQKGVSILLDKQTKKEQEYESEVAEAINEL